MRTGSQQALSAGIYRGHTTAMHLLRSGNDINMVSYWLGYADINPTNVYLEIDMAMKRKMFEKADAPDLREKAPWHEAGILEWLINLGKRPELCGVNRERMKGKVPVAKVNFT